MKTLKLICLLSLISLLNGCLWVVRVPFPIEEKFSNDGERTNVVYRSPLTQIRMNENTNLYCSLKGIYPLTKMRIDATYSAWNYEINTNNYKTGREIWEAKQTKRWLPLTSIVIWLGEPLDLVVDTIMIPWDIE